MSAFRAACVQVNAGADIDANLRAAAVLACDARAAGADLVLMPENVALMARGRDDILDGAGTEDTHKALAAFRELAWETGLWLHCGSLAVSLGDGRVVNRSYLLDPQGEIAAFYDKIHMFDAEPTLGERYRESSVFEAGKRAVVALTPWGGLGLSICYDLRFPGLFRHLARGGASFLAVPSAFTRLTGGAHWHVLLRARAIETGCYVFAPAQCGDHLGGRQTYGHSLIVSPWGAILADAGERPGFVMAWIDPAEVAAARRKVPSLSLEQPFDACDA